MFCSLVFKDIFVFVFGASVFYRITFMQMRTLSGNQYAFSAASSRHSDSSSLKRTAKRFYYTAEKSILFAPIFEDPKTYGDTSVEMLSATDSV